MFSHFFPKILILNSFVQLIRNFILTSLSQILFSTKFSKGSPLNSVKVLRTQFRASAAEMFLSQNKKKKSQVVSIDATLYQAQSS